MRLNEVDFGSAVPIDGYGPGFFRVGGEMIEGGALVLPSGKGPWAGYEALEDIIAAADEIDILIVGTGPEIAHPPKVFRDALDAAGVGVEPMASAAACRTFNVLLSEGRRVGAALLPAA